jgi:penicillin-binding protein 2
MVVSQGGFGASTSGVGVRKIYEAIFGTNGQKSVMPMGIPSTIPNIDVTKFGALKNAVKP